jgi:serine/threonine protein kinase
MILKVSAPESIQHEISVMEHIKDGATDHNLVFVEELEFESASTDVTAINGDISPPYTRVRSGLLMKQFQTTLAQIIIPLPVRVLLKYGSDIKRAIVYMHDKGYCHLDIKPSNVFCWKVFPIWVTLVLQLQWVIQLRNTQDSTTLY